MYKNHKRVYQFSGVLLILLLLIIFGFMQIENLPFFDSLWLTVVSVLAIGYGDYVPSQTTGKILAMTLIPVTMGFSTYMLTFIAASIIEGHLSKKWERKKRMKQMDHMKNHYIICGYERVGEQVFQELYNHGYDLVIIDNDESLVERTPQDTLFLIGDAKQNELLKKAGVERAKGLVATTSDDASNVFITLTAKGLNENVEVIARADKTESENKLKRAGADHVVNLSDLGGRRMALSLIKPVSMHYVDSIIHSESNRYQIEEYKIQERNIQSGKRISDLTIKAEYGLALLGIQRNNDFISNPSGDERIQNQDILVLFGDKEDLEHFFNSFN